MKFGSGLVSGFCFLIRKTAWLAAGGFDNNFGFYGQDSEFFVRMVNETKYRVWIQPRAFVSHDGSSVERSTGLDPEYDFVEDKEKALKLFYGKTAKYRNDF